MPASDYDPLASALAATFKPKGGPNNKDSLSSKMDTSLRKSLLVSVEFDDAVVAPKAKMNPNFIVLKSAHSNNKLSNGARSDVSSNGHQSICSPKASSKPKNLDQVPAPKITLYRKEQIQVGYNRMTGAGSGMRNMGNTCYLNSTLQALLHIPAFVNYLYSGGHDKECGISGFSSCTICILNSTLRQTQQSNVIKPIRIYEKLKFICKHLVHGRQEDAHEFLRYLIESLQRCYLISRKVPKTLDNYSKETTPFNQIFGGYLRQELHCLKCRHVSITFQHFMDLMLDIRNADNIDSALCGYFKKEFLSQEDAYKCEKCKQKVPAHKIYRIERPPLVLCIQLKRFNIMGGKNGRPVTLSKNLDITKFIRWATGCNLSFTYNITSLITHVGPSPNCGHYTAIGQAPNGTYYRFDDDCVNPTSVQNVLNNSAYVIFYEMTKSSRDRYVAAMSDVNNVSSPKTQNGAAANGKKSDVVIGPQLPPNVLNRKDQNRGSNKQPLTPEPSTSATAFKPSPSSSGVNSPLLASKNNPVANNKSLINTNKVNNMPRIVADKQSSVEKERNKFGLVVGNNKNTTVKPAAAVVPTAGLGLVPDYGDGSSSDEEKQVTNTNHSSPKLAPTKSAANDSLNGKVAAKSNKSIFPAIKTPFLPRAVAANLKKNVSEGVKNEALAASNLPTNNSVKTGLDIYDDQDLVDNEAGAACNGAGNGLADLLPDKSSQERHGFMVSDKEAHNPSIHSDNSSGSTVSFTVSDIRPGSGSGASSSSTGTTSRQSWNVVSVKRDRSDEDVPSQDMCASPSKKSKVKEKSMLDGVKTKTSETWREFSKDVMSAGAKLKQQFEVRSNKVTDKIESLTKNIEEILPKFEEPSTSCEASTSQGSSKSKDAADEDAASESEQSSRKKSKKKKKKKKKKVERSRSRSLDRSKPHKERSRSRSVEKCGGGNRPKLEDRLKVDENSGSEQKNGDVRYSSWDRSAPVKHWNNKNGGDHKLDRSATWDGSKKNTNFVDEIKRSSTILSWGGQESKNVEKRERKRSISPSTDDEIDRGRVKKVKKKKEDRHYGYNPFQAVQNMKDKGGANPLKNKFKRNRSSSGYQDSYRSKEGHRDKDYSRRDRSADYSRDYHNHHRRSSWDHNYHRK